MTPIEKAENALNRRLESLQAKLREAKSEVSRRFLFQSLVVSVGLGEALADYVKAIGQYAQGRHGELKQMQETLIAQHADLLKSGNELLERLKADPSDRVIRKEIERAQQAMAGIQKTLRRGADSLQRDVAPSMAIAEKLSLSLRRLGEAEQPETLQRAVKMILENVQELYREHPGLPAQDIIEAEAWEKSAASAIDQASDFYEAYARAGSQALLALDAMTMAVSPNPPSTAEDMTRRAHASVAARLQAIATRFASG